MIETDNDSKMYYGSTSNRDAQSSSVDEFTDKGSHDIGGGLRNNKNLNKPNHYMHKQYELEPEDSMFDGEENIEYDEDEDEEYDDSDESYLLESKKKSSVLFGCCCSSFSCIKQKCFELAALLNTLNDVDNVWDSPRSRPQLTSSHNDEEQFSTLKHKLVVYFWFAVLAFAYAIERSR